MRQTVMPTVAVLTAALCWGWCYFFYIHGGTGPSLNAGPFEESGRLMAQQALQFLEPGGDVTVITRDTSTFKNPANDIQLAGFRQTLAKAHAPIHLVRSLQLDPLRPAVVPASDFCELIQCTPPGSVIVSFLGPPLLTGAERSRLAKDRPAIVAFCSGALPKADQLRALFDQGLLTAAVLDTRGASVAAPVAGNALAHPEQPFLTLTPTNLAALQAAGQL